MLDLDLSNNQRDKKAEWVKARRKTVGASDMPIILGVSPWATPLDLWREKTSTEEPSLDTNWAQANGIMLEPEAREKYEEMVGVKFPAQSFTHKDVQRFTCSMDGWNADTKSGIEIKFSGKEDHLKAKLGQVPDKYVPQVEWQYIVTGAKKITYISYLDGDLAVVEVERPNDVRIDFLIKKAAEFLHMVDSKKKPPMTDRDVLDIDDNNAIATAKRYKEIQAQIKVLEHQLENIREELLDKYKLHARVKIGPLSMTKSIKKGSINYQEVPGVDFDKYRKPDVEIWTIR